MPDIFDASAAKKNTHPEELEVDEANEVHTKTHAENNHSHRLARDVNEYSMIMREEPSSNNPFKSFVAKPEKIFFDSQHYEERVLLLLRRHPVTQLGWIIVAMLLALAPILFSSVGLLDFLPPNYQLAATIGWYLILTGFVLESFLTWFYNVYIITDERVIDVDFFNLLFKNISAAKIDNIEDVTAETGGLMASVFNYGTVKIQTAGAVTEFDFEDVPQPAKVTAFLNEMLLEEEREKLENRAS